MSLPNHIVFARELRKYSTPQENMLWQLLRDRRLNGIKFLRQHPIIVEKSKDHTSFYIADFFCAQKKLVIEIDGRIHSFRIVEDRARDIAMNELGLQVIRISNDEVEKDISAVLQKILALC